MHFTSLRSLHFTSRLLRRFLSILNVVVVTSVSLAFQSAVNAPSVAITAFCWGFYLEFCVISSFLHYLIPQYFSFRHVVVLNFLLYPTALLPIVYSIASSPHDFFRGLFFSTFYLYGGCFAFLAGLWLLSLRRAYLASRLTLRQYAGSLSNNDVCILSLLAGLAITSLTLLVVFHALIPAFPFIGHTSNAMHLLVDISRSCLCIFTYIIPYRMFRERLIEARRDLEIKTEFVKYCHTSLRSLSLYFTSFHFPSLHFSSLQFTSGSFLTRCARLWAPSWWGSRTSWTRSWRRAACPTWTCCDGSSQSFTAPPTSRSRSSTTCCCTRSSSAAVWR